MVRGTQKQIIHLKNPESPLYEEAFLIVKSAPQKAQTRRTMVEEANRLLGEVPSANTYIPQPPREDAQQGFSPIFWLVVGFFVGAILTNLIWLLF